MTSLPLAPRKPDPEECCGQGCHTCVLDTYAKEFEIWQKECAQLVSCRPFPRGQGISPDIYAAFELVSISVETAETSIYTFRSDYRLDGLVPGMHMICRGSTFGKEAVFREYTPFSWTTDEFQVLIKLYPEGLMSGVILKWQPGDFVDWRGPVGDFQLQRCKRRIIMFAMGTGVAPVIPIISAIVEEESEKEERVARLLLGVKRLDLTPLKKKLQDFARFWNFSCSLYVSDDQSHVSAPAYLEVHTGKIDSEVLAKELSKVDSKETTIIACGTRTFEQQLSNKAKELGLHDFVTF